jgi:prepilin-type N-terminal cleavage/methylation domain-containing protein
LRTDRGFLQASAGFSIIEVLVATAIVAVGLASLAQLFVSAANVNRLARMTSTAALLAGQKMEQLRGETGLGPSPPGALSANTPGYIDYLDPSGVSLGMTSVTPPAGAAYVCRWSIEPLPSSQVNTVVLQVLVSPWPYRDRDTHRTVTRAPGEARLVAVQAHRSS